MVTIKNIQFEPVYWNFSCDGMNGHLYFVVPKDTFEIGQNNGAYAHEKIPEWLTRIGHHDDFEQVVSMAMPCSSIDEDIWRELSLSFIFTVIANDIYMNLTLKDK